MTDSQLKEWVVELAESLPRFLEALTPEGRPGRLVWSTSGTTKYGRRAGLGYSCFGLKIHYMLNLWEGLSDRDQEDWIGFINSFQLRGQRGSDPVSENGYVDPVLIKYLDFLDNGGSLFRRVRRKLMGKSDPPLAENEHTRVQKGIIAETKQALATLLEVGHRPLRSYGGFPRTEQGVDDFFSGQNWAIPWSAGGQTSALTVFVTAIGPELVGPEKAWELARICGQWYDRLADPETGCYIDGPRGDLGYLINGAMKVLTGQAWLDQEIHYPERLIDTCLIEKPRPDGCFLVDAVYVLHRCQKITDHRRMEIREYVRGVLDLIRNHSNPDGGFSYFVGQTGNNYYGMPTAQGEGVSDIHGTCLLTWALIMILDILEENRFAWRAIKP